MYIPMWISIWIIIGGLAGLLASLVVRGTGLGLLGDILIGIVGAILGGFLFQQFGHPGVTSFDLYSLFVAFIGAVILLLIVRMASGGRRYPYRRRGY